VACSGPAKCKFRSQLMNSASTKSLSIVAAIGLALGAVFGLAGTLLTQSNLRNTAWGIDALGLIMATALLALKFFRRGHDLVAAGFLVFAIGEAVILSGTAAGLAGSAASFAAGTGLWATALLLISIPKEFPSGTRFVGITTSILFGVTSARMFWGEPLLPTSSPLPLFGYPFLVLTLIGWIWTLLREFAPPTSERKSDQ
jgi:hypothetical protein